MSIFAGKLSHFTCMLCVIHQNLVITCPEVKVKVFCFIGVTLTSWYPPSSEISMESFHYKCAYKATRNGCQPGFCKLIRCRAECDYFSRIEFLQMRQHIGFNVNFDQTNRGPCYSTNYPDGFDCCHALPVHPDSSNVFLKKNENKVLEWC